MLFLASQIVLVGLAVLGLYRLRGRFGLSPVFVFVASVQFLQNLLVTTTWVELPGGYTVSPGSAVLFSSTLFTVLLIYLKEDIETTRRLIYAILLANLVLSLVAVNSQSAISRGHLQQVGPLSDWLPHYSTGTFAIGAALLIVDSFLLLVIYEVIRSRLGWIPLWVRVVFSLSFVLAFDTVAFVLLALRSAPDPNQLLIGNLIGKTLAGVLYGGLLSAFLWQSRDTDTQRESREIRDPFSILTFGKRYRALEREVDELERLRTAARQRAEIALLGAQLGAWDWNVQSGRTDLDKRWAEMLGYEPEEIELKVDSWKRRIHPDDRERVLKTLDAHLDGTTPFYEVEHRLRTRSGNWKWILSMGKVIERDRDGRPLRMTGTHMDIDRRKQAEERALRFGHVVESSLNEIYTFDAETLVFIDVNAGACDNLGYSLEELRKLTPVDLKPEFTVETFTKLIEPLRASSRSKIEFETVHLRKDGTRYPVEVHLQRMPGDSGVFVAILLDITERLQAGIERRNLEKRYRELFENAPLKYVLTEVRDGVALISDCNSTFLEILGYQRDEVIGHPLSEFYSASSARESRQSGAEDALGRRLQEERQLVTKDGKIVETLLVALPETDSTGRVTGMRAMFADITTRKEAERRQRAFSSHLVAVREEERKAIAREIHDDLGQALTALKLELSWLSGKLEASDDLLRARTGSMISIVDQSIEEVKDLSARLRPAVLDDLGLSEAVRWHAREYSGRYGIDCVMDEEVTEGVDTSVDPEIVTGVFRILQEAMTNILRHAEASRVEITLKHAEDELELRVSDNGKGFDLNEPQGRGSLGLLGMRERAEGLGGTLEISRSKSGGTTVSARVPQ